VNYFIDYEGRSVILDEEVKNIVFSKHPETLEFIDRIAITLRNPDIVKRSKTSKRVKLYYRFFIDILQGKYFVVVVKQVEQYYISTFYITDKVKEGEILWQRNE